MNSQSITKMFNRNLFIGFVLYLVMISCSSESNKQSGQKDSDSAILSSKVEIHNSLFKFNNVLFCMPSAYEFAYYIKNIGINYRKEYLNPISNAPSYNSSFKKSVNLGIYSTDIGYLTIFDQTPEAISYFTTVKDLAFDLGISSIYEKNIISRIEKNMNNRDSLLYIFTSTNREADNYLKDNDRNAFAALILTGGWIESMYMLTQIAKSMPVKEIYQRIAEQKHPLDNLIKILSTNYNKEDKDFVEMTEILVELAYEYDGVDYKYEYKKPRHNPQNNFTIIESVSELTINQEQVKAITRLTEKLRAIITKK